MYVSPTWYIVIKSLQNFETAKVTYKLIFQGNYKGERYSVWFFSDCYYNTYPKQTFRNQRSKRTHLRPQLIRS